MLVTKSESFNRIIGLFQFRRPTFFVRDPKLLKFLTVKEFDHFPDHGNFMDESVDKMFGKSLVNLNGDKWRGELNEPYKELAVIGAFINQICDRPCLPCLPARKCG